MSIPILLFMLKAFSSTAFGQIEDETEVRFSGFAYTDAGSPVAGGEICVTNKLKVKKPLRPNCVSTESDGRFSVLLRKQKGDGFVLFASTGPKKNPGQEIYGSIPALRIVNPDPDDTDLAETEIKLGFRTQVVNGDRKPSVQISTQNIIEVCRLDAPLVCTVQKYTWTPGIERRPYEISTPAAPFTFRFRFERDEWVEWIAVAKNNRTAKRLRVGTDADDGHSIKVTVIK